MRSDHAIHCARETDLDPVEFRRLLLASGLAAIRPAHDVARLDAMLAGAGLIVTARLATRARPLVGVARCLTDFAWCAYLAELAVDCAQQGRGIGQRLLDETRRLLGPQVSLSLASVPDAVGFYQRAGMERVVDAFWFRREH
jgi:ribosomal protein S18 acetylase RimI-like enzyme